MTAYGERIARLEERVTELGVRMDRIEGKLDELLALKNKGAGAFWLASIIFGAGMVGIVTSLLQWWRS